ncbi:hypothetical protein B0H21DRAFT_823604 [Amylocystis lapponica]|nr:hypothetical protein B0H21DRAFT_823604 [Amylocystis lapponica]
MCDIPSAKLQGITVLYQSPEPVYAPFAEHLIYGDATHDMEITSVVTVLNLMMTAADRPLPFMHIPKDQTHRIQNIALFSANMDTSC